MNLPAVIVAASFASPCLNRSSRRRGNARLRSGIGLGLSHGSGVFSRRYCIPPWWILLPTSDASIPNCGFDCTPSAQLRLEGVPDFTRGSLLYQENGDPASPFSRHPQNFMTPGRFRSPHANVLGRLVPNGLHKGKKADTRP